MDKNKLSNDARIATATFILAEQRLIAIHNLKKDFDAILDAYDGSNVALSKLHPMAVEFSNWAHERVEKLAEIASSEKARAAQLTALLVEGE